MDQVLPAFDLPMKGSKLEVVDLNTDQNSDESAERIDAVYLWVDGGEKAFQESLNRHLPPIQAAGDCTGMTPNRYRDNGELRFSLRSLEQFAPWVRHVYLVTNGQVPSWLNRNHPRVTVVPHDTLFLNRGHLPTFNSNAIELQLHRIPGLSRQFLYLNDDVFFGAPTPLQTFFLPSGAQRLFLQRTLLHVNAHDGPVHDRSYAYTQGVIYKAWRRFRARRLPAHVPQLYDREIIAEIERRIPSEFEKTASHRFRSADDVVLRILYFSMVSEGSPDGRESETILDNCSQEYGFAMLERSVRQNALQLLSIARLRPRFFCINDDVERGAASHLLLRGLPWFLQKMFPNPSAFEAE